MGSTWPTDDGKPPEVFLLHFFEQHTGHPLIAWVQYFDRNNDRKVSQDESIGGMKEMGFEGDAANLFQKLDEDESGFLTISEISPSSSDLWASFQHWAGKTFFSEEDMIEKLSGRKFAEKRKATKLTEDKGMTKKEFYNYASSLGWYGGFDQILFLAMDIEKKGHVYQSNIPWFEEERNRQIKMAKYKTRGNKMQAMRKRLHALRSLQAFTSWLRYHYGCRLFHPWRRGIDNDGSMHVTRLELSTFCKNAGWRGDSNALWHALDSDESGSTSLDEFAGSEARQLALFRKWTMHKFGNARKLFQALIKKCHRTGQSAKMIDKDDFRFACEALGYQYDPSEVFDILDWEADGDACLTYKELRFLDSWTPVEWLSANPDKAEAAAFKAVLLAKCKQPLKAWRTLDDDGSGKVNYKEFAAVAHKIGFRGDLMGAWMALDSDASGYIALTEIDPHCADALAEFRRWANLFFGSVMDAFRALDSDGGGTLSRAEFKKSVTKYNFRGDREELFTMLDTACDGDISVEEMAFLDEWEVSEVSQDPPSFREVESMLKRHRNEDSDSAPSDSEDKGCGDACTPRNFERTQTRKPGGLKCQEAYAFIHESERPHIPMPGKALAELLGGFSSRCRTRSDETNLTSTSIFSVASSNGDNHLCSRGSQRSHSNRLRKQVPYTGGNAFRLPSDRRPVCVGGSASIMPLSARQGRSQPARAAASFGPQLSNNAPLPGFAWESNFLSPR